MLSTAISVGAVDVLSAGADTLSVGATVFSATVSIAVTASWEW